MTLKDEKTSSANSNGTSKVKLLRAICPECGSDSLFRGSPGYVCREFIKAVVREPHEKLGTLGHSAGGDSITHIAYERLSDGSLNCDYYEDEYERSRYEDDEFFACAACEEVLKFADGSEVREEEDLAELLALNGGQSEEDNDRELHLQCQTCGGETFFIRQRKEETPYHDKHPSYVCANCGGELAT